MNKSNYIAVLSAALTRKISIMRSLFRRAYYSCMKYLLGDKMGSDEQISYATEFRDVLRAAAFLKKPLEMTVRSGGREASVMLTPDDPLVLYAFQWVQGYLFMIRTGDFQWEPPTKHPYSLSEKDKDAIRLTIKAWGEMMIAEGKFPVALISRSEPENQQIFASARYSKEDLKIILGLSVEMIERLVPVSTVVTK